MIKTRLQTLQACLFMAAGRWIKIRKITVDAPAFDVIMKDLCDLSQGSANPMAVPQDVKSFVLHGPVGSVEVHKEEEEGN